ncbi:AbrB/MazE/SpoVT family DNA-binding domain-containing protein [Candidatus Woesearchaeota archaeon]|nr:AbrB/MazE/SpoVT family DNA-binding domain-containing protein [Candidatus Woesearchaeota archaeon]
MIECEAIIKKWGNSFGVVLSKPFLKKNKLSPHDKIKIIITKESKKNAAQKLWGALPFWKTSSDDLEKYADKEFDLPV